MKCQLIFILCCILSLCSCKKKQGTLTREEVIQVINRFDKGWENKDLKLVDSTLANSYVYFTQSGNTFSRDSVVATAGEPDYSLSDMSRTEIEINLDGNTAVVSTRWKGKGYYRGTAFDEDQRCSIVVVKENGKATILSEHCTPIKSNRIFH